MFLKQSTTKTIRFGPFLDSTDGVTPETGLTIAQADMQLSKDGGTFAQKNASGNATHDTDGWYSTSLDQTDTATVGILKLQINVAGSVPVWETFYVMEEAPFNAMYVAGAQGPLQGTTAGNKLDVTAAGNAGIDWGNIENATTSVDLSGTDIQLVDTVTTYTGNTVQTGDNFARLGAPAGASVSADVAAVKVDTAAILVDTGTTLDGKIDDIQGATFNTSTDSLEAIRDRGDAAWVTGAGGSDRLLLVDTTIATLATQTSFTLTAGSADNDAYNNCTIVIEDVSTATQKSLGMVLAYTGATKTVTLKEALAFTIATTDKVYILAENSLKSTVANRQLDVTATGASGIDWANVENPTTALDLSGTDIQSVGAISGITFPANFSDLVIEVSTGRIDVGAWVGNNVTFGTGGPDVNINAISDDTTAASNLELDYDGTGFAKANSTIGTCTTNTDAITVAGILTTQMTESYSSDGSAPTLTQSLMLIQQVLTDFGYTGTSNTVKKLDGSTTAAVMTLDDGTNPTNSTRTS